MNNRTIQRSLIAVSVLAATAVPIIGASADDHGGRRAIQAPIPPVVAKECSSCHMVYPAGLLPAASWQRMMANLNDHFGENASLDAATTAAVTAYLTQNASDAGRVGREHEQKVTTAADASLRISEQPWFRKEHREVTPASLQRRGAKSISNCSACHKNAEQGQFEGEDED